MVGCAYVFCYKFSEVCFCHKVAKCTTTAKDITKITRRPAVTMEDRPYFLYVRRPVSDFQWWREWFSRGNYSSTHATLTLQSAISASITEVTHGHLVRRYIVDLFIKFVAKPREIENRQQLRSRNYGRPKGWLFEAQCICSISQIYNAKARDVKEILLIGATFVICLKPVNFSVRDLVSQDSKVLSTWELSLPLPRSLQGGIRSWAPTSQLPSRNYCAVAVREKRNASTSQRNWRQS